MDKFEKERSQLLGKLAKSAYFIKGSLNDYCAKCCRSKCICKNKTDLRSYRLTYKDQNQKTQVVYVPRDKVKQIEKMLDNYSKVKDIIDEIFNLNIKQFKNSE